MLGEWSESLKVFWFGGMDMEYIAWKGSHEILVYDCSKYPCPPNYVIKFNRRIRTLEDFNDALTNGLRMEVYYKEVGTGAFED